ncbi:HEAT repeat domain-containing protein [Amycolatopsis sp. NPDC003676]
MTEIWPVLGGQTSDRLPERREKALYSLDTLDAMAKGFEAAIRMMRSRDPQRAEDGFGWLRDHAAEHLPALIEQFENEQADRGLRSWLLELIGIAESPEALPVLTAQLNGTDELLRDWAVIGLTRLNTREARTALWRARANGAIA